MAYVPLKKNKNIKRRKCNKSTSAPMQLFNNNSSQYSNSNNPELSLDLTESYHVNDINRECTNFSNLFVDDKVHQVMKMKTPLDSHNNINLKSDKDQTTNFNYEHFLLPDIANHKCTTYSEFEIKNEKYLDIKRWNCVVRPQYSKSCGITSLVSCWNYLYSLSGYGNHQPITQEEAMLLIGLKPPFEDIKFGPFTGNSTLMRWFYILNNHYGVNGRCYFLYKPKGCNKTNSVDAKKALILIEKALKDRKTSVIYHCHNHYMCPIGFENTPIEPEYVNHEHLKKTESWVMIADSSKKHPPIHCKNWNDIVMDLNTEMPSFLDIRNLENGLQINTNVKRIGGNLHCLMAFEAL